MVPSGWHEVVTVAGSAVVVDERLMMIAVEGLSAQLTLVDSLSSTLVGVRQPQSMTSRGQDGLDRLMNTP
jgi:hypothetical protein